MTEITLPASNLSTIDPDDPHGYNPEADTGHLLVQLPDRTKIVLFEAVCLNLGLRFSSVYKNHNVLEIGCIFFFRCKVYEDIPALCLPRGAIVSESLSLKRGTNTDNFRSVVVSLQRSKMLDKVQKKIV
jgi:hypothetical protein